MTIQRDKNIVMELLKHAGIECNGPNPSDIQIHDEATFSRVVCDNSLGLGESYMAGMWDCQALDQLFEKILRAQLEKKIKKTFDYYFKFFSQKL